MGHCRKCCWTHLNGIDNVLADLEGEDYAVQTFVIPACACWSLVTVGTESGLLPTPTNSQMGSNTSMRRNHTTLKERITMWPISTIVQRDVGDFYGINDQQEKSGDKSRRGCGENGSSRRENVKPTPCTRDYKGGRKLETLKLAGRNETKLVTRCDQRSKPGNWLLEPAVGQKWLMGFPEGWTDLNN